MYTITRTHVFGGILPEHRRTSESASTEAKAISAYHRLMHNGGHGGDPTVIILRNGELVADSDNVRRVFCRTPETDLEHRIAAS